MQRTNIYLDEEQVRSLDEAARAQHVSRAELVRTMIDRAFGSGQHDEMEQDLTAIEASFGVLDESDWDEPARGDDARAAHLDAVARHR